VVRLEGGGLLDSGARMSVPVAKSVSGPDAYTLMADQGVDPKDVATSLLGECHAVCTTGHTCRRERGHPGLHMKFYLGDERLVYWVRGY
jgi:hypothetical protein